MKLEAIAVFIIVLLLSIPLYSTSVYGDMIGRAYQDERHPSAEEAFAELLQIYRYHRYEEVLISELIVNILEYAYELGDPELSLEDNLEIALIQFEAMFPV